MKKPQEGSINKNDSCKSITYRTQTDKELIKKRIAIWLYGKTELSQKHSQ